MKSIIIILSLLFLVIAPYIVLADNAEVKVTLASQSPDPVEPGQVVLVKFKIENNGDESLSDAVVKLMPKYPFKLYGDEAEKNIGKLRASSTGADAVIVEYHLKVDEQAVESEIEIELAVLFGDGGGASYTDNELLIDIQTHDAVLDITSISSTPSSIAPGQDAKIDISVKNLADSLLKDIRFKLDFSAADLPLAPYQSSSERRLAQLQSGFQNSLSFKLIADPDALPGLYKVPLNITYNDEKGNSYLIEDVLAVSIGETPKIRVYIKKSSVHQSNSAGVVTLEIANAGTTDIKFLELSLLDSEDYTLVSTSDYIYIGDIDSDDTESEELDIYIKRWKDKLKLPVRLQYYDANNKQYTQQFELVLSLYSSSKLKKFGLLENNTWTYFFLLLLIAGAAYWYYKRKSKKRFVDLLQDLKVMVKEIFNKR